MRLRRATVADAAGIAGVQTRTWRDAYPFVDRDVLEEAIAGREEHWREVLAGGSPMWVALDGGSVAGIMSAAGCRDEGDERMGELWMLYVAPERQGRGLGAALADAADDELRRLGFAEAVVWVFEQNLRGRTFYARSGWAPDGASKPDAWDRKLRYRKRL